MVSRRLWLLTSVFITRGPQMTVKAAWRDARNVASHLIQLCLLEKCFQCKEIILWKPSFWAMLKYNCHPVSWAHFSMLSSMNCVIIVPWILCLMFHISDVCKSGRLVEGLEARGLRGFIYEWMYSLTVAAGCSSRRASHTHQETVLDPWVLVSWKLKSLWHFYGAVRERPCWFFSWTCGF